MNFKKYRIADLIDDISMGPFGSNIKVDCFVDSGVPVLNGSNLDGFTLKEESFRYVTEEKADSLKRANAKKGDIVITHRGTLGQIVYIPQNAKYERYVISQSQFRIRCNEHVLPEYLVFYFHTRVGQHKILSNASQVGVPALARPSTTFQQIEVELPDIEVQKKIVSILQSFNDKIELNNKINANLQQQAQAIFKSWFVDFELFQDGEFVESELGPIPKGWSVGRLADICTYGKDKIAVSELTPENYFSTENMLANKGGYTSAASLPNVLQTARCVPGDTLVSNIRPYFKKIVYCMMNAGCSTDVLCLRPKHSKYNTYLYNLGYSDAFFDYMVSGSKGTKMPRGDKQQIMSYPVILPPDEVIAQFHEFADAVLKKIWVALEESKKLTVLRDGLLQKLMSGELNLSDI